MLGKSCGNSTISMTDLATKLEIFEEFLDCSGIALWHFDGEMRLISTNAPNREELLTLFNISGCKKTIRQYCMKQRLPGFCSDTASLIWLAAPKYVNGSLADVFIIGPVFSSSTSGRALTQSLRDLHASPELLQSTLTLLKSVPVIPHTFLMQYGLMLHRCLTDEKLETADVQVITAPISAGRIIPTDPEREPHTGAYALEQKIFQAVEDGNEDFVHPKEIYQRNNGILHRTDPLRSAKNEIITCITLITRAAIRGGMPEESAYALSDYYILLLEDSGSIAEVYKYSQDAFKDFTSRVHKCKMRQGKSKEILDCASYLQLHIGQKVTMAELSDNLGYNKNYLSSEFSREVGMTISDYLLELRMERAKILLLNTDKSVQQIGDELGFNSVSYFSAQFRKKSGQSPSAFRDRRET